MGWNEMSGNKKVSDDISPDQFNVSVEDLLNIPSGGVTMTGLELNIKVAVTFIHKWLNAATGCFPLNNKAEDSATAEISRCQVWQWIRHGALLEAENGATSTKVTFNLVRSLVDKMIEENDMKRAGDIFLDLVTRRDMPEFITTFLSGSYFFRFM